MDMCEGDVWVEHPLHMLEVPSGCTCLTMRPTRDLDSQAQTTTKSKKSIIIAWSVEDFPNYIPTNAFNLLNLYTSI